MLLYRHLLLIREIEAERERESLQNIGNGETGEELMPKTAKGGPRQSIRDLMMWMCSQLTWVELSCPGNGFSEDIFKRR